MSRKEHKPRYLNSGAKVKNKKRQVEKLDNTIDLTLGKPPANSTYQTHVRNLNKRIAQTASSIPTYNNFDRLKICVDLRLYAKQIKFEIVSMHETQHPDKHTSYVQKDIAVKRQIQVISNSPASTAILNEDDFLESDSIDESGEPLQKREGKNEYPNCGISQERLPTGLNAIYIKDDYFIVDITGKWMAEEGNLGLISIHNIIPALKKVLNQRYVSFNVASALKIATVRLCDVTMDVETLKQNKLIAAVSSLSPTFKPSYDTHTYKNGGLIIKGTAQNTGMSFTMYNKGKELEDKRHSYQTYLSTIGEIGLEKARNTLRLEAHLYRLKDIREILEIPNKESYQVLLEDVLRSKKPAILNVLKKYQMTEEILKDKILGFTDTYLSNPQSADEVRDLLAGIGLMTVLLKQEDMYRATRDFLVNNFRLEDNETIMKNLSKNMQECFYNFNFYFRAPSIRDVLELLDLIHRSYGRNSRDNNEELEKAA